MRAAATVDRRVGEPLRDQVRKVIYGEIAGGAYSPGDKLPTEREYATRLRVSLAPVRAALAQLVQSGHLERTQGRGTFVVETKVPYALRLLSSTTDSLRAAGVPFETRVIECGVVEPPEDVIEDFGLTGARSALRLRRVVTVRDRPAILLESWMRERLADLVATRADHFNASGSLYQVLRERGLDLARSRGRLDLTRATDLEARDLGLPFGHPLFEIRTIVADTDGHVIEKSRCLYDPDRFTLRLDRALADERWG